MFTFIPGHPKAFLIADINRDYLAFHLKVPLKCHAEFISASFLDPETSPG
jgi:hypothetical protein